MSNIQPKTQAFFKYSKMKSRGSQTRQGFTLIEMLLVIAIIAILAGIVIVAINPGRQLAQARNAERQSDLNAIYKALDQYYIDNRQWPDSDMSSSLTEICDTGSTPGDGTATGGIGDSSCSGKIDLSNLVPDYLTAIPTDPLSGGIYAVALPASNRPQLTAPSSTEYSLDIVAIGTTTSEVAGGGGEEDTTVADLRVGLVGYWPLDEDNSTQPDESENSNSATVYGATYTSSGKVNGAYDFDGSNDYMEASDHSSLDITTEFTIAAWVNVSGGGGSWNRFFSKWSGSAGWIFFEDAQHIKLYTTAGVVATTATIPLNEWAFIAVTRESDGTITFYPNGSTPETASLGAATDVSSALRFSRSESSSDWVDGIMDELAVWSRALSADEIDNLHNSGNGLSLISE